MNTLSMPAPRISIIVPVHNAAAFLPALLESLSAQTERNLEIIAIDDGSTDASPALLAAHALLDPRLVVITQRNAGVSAARNRGLDAARGEWIGFADADDWLYPDTFARWRELAEATQADVVIGSGFALEAGIDSAPLFRAPRLAPGASGRDWLLASVGARHWPHNVFLQLIRRELIEGARLRFPEGMIHEDIVWTLDLALLARRVSGCDTALYGYRQHQASLVHRPTAAARWQRLAGYAAVMEHLSTAAKQQHADRQLRSILLQHLTQQAAPVLGLLRALKRDGAAPGAAEAAVAQRLGAWSIGLDMLHGARGAGAIWCVLRCLLLLRGAARGAPGHPGMTIVVDDPDTEARAGSGG